MAELTWVGTDTGNEGDWSVAANWSPAQVPADGDDVLLGPGGLQSVISGLSQASVTLDTLTVTSDWTAGRTIGSAANYLQINANTVVWNGTGQMHLDLGTTSTLATVKMNAAPSDRDKLHIKGNALLLVVTAGKLTWDSGTVTDMAIQSSGADLLLSSPTVTNVVAMLGKVEMDGAGTISNLFLGASAANAFIEEGTLTNAKVYGGNLFWRTAETLASCKVYGGKLDASGDQRAKTITLLELWGSGQADVANGLGNITVSTLKTYGSYALRQDPA